MDDPKELLQHLASIMSGANAAELVHKIVDLYDETAQTAYDRLMDADEVGDPKEVAARAWEYADAMMAERARRGIGNLPGKEG